MIQMSTRLNVADNCGALVVECIKVLQNGKFIGKMGDLIVVAIKKAYANKKIKTHDVHRAVIVRTVKPYYRKKFNTYVGFTKNEVVILDKKNNPVANRIKGPVCRELRRKKLMKLLSLAPIVI